MKNSIKKFLIIILFFSFWQNFSLAKEKKKTSKNLSLSVRTSLIYDNNILRYSDYYLNEFQNGINNGRFHISTYDDMIFTPELQIAYRKQIVKKLFSEIFIRTKFNKYFVNSIKDWGNISFGLKQNFPYKFYIRFKYDYTPHYYIRHYRDKEWIEFYGNSSDSFKEYWFAKDNYEILISKKILKNLSLNVLYNFADYYFGKYFTEYDAEQNIFGGKIFYRISRKLKINAGMKYVYLKAKGKPGVDPSYNEYKYYLSGSYSLHPFFGIKNSVALSLIYNERFYSSNYNFYSDPLHSGRYDKSILIFLYYNFTFKNIGDFSFFYNFNKRDAETVFNETTDSISRDKSFSQQRFGLKYKYSIKF